MISLRAPWVMAVLLAVSGCSQPGAIPRPVQPAPSHSAASRGALQGPGAPINREVAIATHQAFRDWVTGYSSAPGSDRSTLEAQGLELAAARHEAMRALVTTDPALAIALAMSAPERDSLPRSVAEHVETWHDGVGTVHVIGGFSVDGTPLEVQRAVTFDDAPDVYLTAGLYGGRAEQATRQHVRLHGVAIDGAIAVLDARLRKLSPGETPRNLPTAAPDPCPISGNAVDASQVYDGADTLFGFCLMEHAMQYEQTLATAEDAQQAAIGAPASASAWASGVKQILFIRLDFSDKAGDPVALASITSMMNTTVNNFYLAASYQLTSIQATITPTLRLPKTRADYITSNNPNELLNDGRAAALAAGFDYTKFDFDIVAFAATYGGGWAGQAYVGSKGLWLNGYFDLRVIGHELGHNLGVYHANYWNASGLTIIGPGSNVEYGNPFDMMSSGGNATTHFNAWFKRTFDWIQTQEVAVVTTSGTYRMTTLEQPMSGAGYHAIKVPRDAQKDYWLEFRTGISNVYLQNGASVDWGYKYLTGSHLLDLTPGDNDKNNSALLIGRTFSDLNAGIHLTPVGKGGTSPESLDVVVNLGTFPGNHPPTATLSASTNTPTVGQPVTFNTTASDPDSDPLAYAWTFDDGSFGPNASTASKSFGTARDYQVLLTVSDMKGGTVTRSALITVGTPTTFTLQGHVLLGAAPVPGVRISDGTRATFTDSTGAYALTQVPAGSFTLTAGKVDTTFAPGFTNPVAVTAGMTGLDFTASAVAGYQVAGKVSGGGGAVPGVVVSNGTLTATTNATGDYALTPVPTGLYTMTATKPGWIFAPSFTAPMEVLGGNVTAINFYAQGTSMAGTIPTAGVTTAPQVTDGVRTATATVSGASWYFNLSGVPNGTWNVVATSPGVTLLPDFTNPVTIAAGVGIYSLTFHVSATAGVQVSGTVKTGGTALPGVTVTDGTHTSKTDALGRYVLVGVPPGSITLTPSLAGYSFLPATRPVTVAAAAITGQDFATTVVNLPPTVVTASSASPNPVTTGVSTALSVLGTDDSGEGALTYTWSNSATGYPVTYSASGTNAAKHATATFAGASTYTIDCTITDPGGLSVHSATVVSVLAVPTSLAIAPASGSLLAGATLSLQAKLKDQFGNANFTGTPAWTVTGPGTLSTATGWSTVLTAGATPGPVQVTLTIGAKTANATVTVTTAAAPSITTAASATPSPVLATTSTLSVRATDDKGEPALTYTWAMTSGPAAVSYAANGSNAAKDSLVTFAKAGDYTFLVTVTDGDGNSITSTVPVTVHATATALELQPAVATLQVNQTQAFTATVNDQFGDPLAPQPAIAWAIAAGGTVSAAGLFTAGAVAGGPFTLSATEGALVKTAQITLGEAPDTTPPAVSLTSPAPDAAVSGLVPLLATASDNVAVIKVEFWLDGATRLGEATASPWQLLADFSAASDGVHTLSAKAFDAAGNSATSDTISVTVGNAPVDHSAPVVSITAPGASAQTSLSVAVSVTASDDVGVTKVELELDGQVVKTVSSSPWAASLEVAAGAHTLVATAFDASGKFSRSEAVAFTALDASTGADGGSDGGIDPGGARDGRVLGSLGCSNTGGGASWPALLLAALAVLRSRRRST